ncbi:MAG: hypothetical protein QXH60_02955 [Candidatus Pacearchaeota archaeon]
MPGFKCLDCNKEFSSKEALEMHNNSKHYTSSRIITKEKKKIKNWTAFIVIAALIVAGGYALTLQENKPGKYDAFAQCLTDSGVKMFGAFWCSHCEQQKENFGSSWKKVNYIECSNPDRSQNSLCNQEGIDGYPTWEFADGSRRSGFISLETLSEISGCPLNSSLGVYK